MLVRDTGIEPVADCYLRTRKLRRCAPHPIPNGAGVFHLGIDEAPSGASEAEITEAVEVGYLFGGTAALVMGVNAFKSS
jgi:hypothetical protein